MMCRHVKVLHTEIIQFSRHYSEQAHNEGALGGVGGTLKKKTVGKAIAEDHYMIHWNSLEPILRIECPFTLMLNVNTADKLG